MTDGRTDIPSPSAPNFDQRVREALQTYLGRQGNPLDRGLTLRDMIESGLISLKDGYRLRPGGGGGLPLAPGPAATVDATPDLTPPPTPTGLTAVGAISHVFIEHDAPLYRQGHGHLRTRLYGKIVNTGDPLPTFGDATEIAQFSGTVYAHPSNPATTWRLWVKWESADGVLSASPAGGTNGIEAVTGQDVGALLDALAGQITESQLYADLGSRIDLIDTDAAGSVNDRIRTEAAGRITALLQEANARSAADSTLASTQEAIGTRTIDAASAILAEADARISAGSVIAAALDATGLQAGILAANAVNETARRVEDGFSIASTTSAITASQASTAAALQVERVVRATESEALSRQTSTLVSISGANVSALTMEQQTRAEETSASASQVTSLAATVGANAAAITSEQQARSDEASSAARQISTLSAATDAANAAIQVEQQARADQSSSLAQQTTTLASTTANATAGLLQEQLARTEENLATASAMIGLSSVVGDNTAGLKVEQQTRTDEASSSASQVAALVATAGSNSAAIQMEQLARSNETSATASQITSLSSAAGDNASTLKVLQQTQANAESASSAMNTTLASAVGGNAAAIQTELATRADADSASAGAVSTLAVASGVNTAGLFSEQQVRADASSSMASTVAGLAAVSSANSAGILAEQSARANAQTALAEQINTLSAATAENAASITNEQQARVDETVALASQITTLKASAGAAPGLSRLRFWGFDTGLEGWSSTYASASNGIATWAPTASNSSFIRSLSASEQYIGSQAPVIRARVRRLSGAGNWEGSLFHSTAAHVASTSYRKTISAPANPDVWNELEWDMSQLTTGGADYLDNEITALRIDLVSDAGTSVWEFDWIAVGTRSVTPQDAALQIEATTRALETGDLFAQYTVKIDVAGHVSGYGLASTANGSTPTSQFGVRANQFFVAPPSVILETAPTTDLYKGYVWVDSSVTPNVTRYYTGSAWSTTPQALPFVIQTGATTINGESVPAGVYIDDAYIKNGTITNAKIGDAAIDNAKISNVAADKLTAGSIAVGQYIQSTSYVAGSAGWKINGNGGAEFSNVTVRGAVYATSGQFWGTLLGGAASDYSTGLGLYAGGGTTTDGADYRWRVGSPSGARIQWTGSSIEVYNASNQLTMSSGGITASQVSGLGALATQNSVSTGQVTGLGTLATQSSVNWNAQITNIPAFGNFAYLSSITSANISSYIAGAAIGAAYISDAAITRAKIGNAAVGSAQIADAAITTAKIGSLQVNTLQIADNAVTIPVSAYTSGSTNIPGSVETTVQSASLVSTGAPIFLLFTSNIANGNVLVDDGDSDYYDSTPTQIKIYRGSTLIQSSSFADSGAMAVTIQDTPGSGNVTYYAKAYSLAATVSDGSSEAVVSARSLFLLETKR